MKGLNLLMLKAFFTFCLVTTSNLSFSQGGPGGVGNSTNNKVWLDANRGLTIIAGGVNVWADQSGNAFNATANGAAARPTLVAGSVNGYPSLDFDGANDEMWINDNVALDLTQWHFFIVPAVDLAKDYNAWLTKGNDGQENYEMLSYSTNNMHAPLFFTDATRTSPSSAAGVVGAGFNIIEYSFVNTVGRDIYRNSTSIFTDNEAKTPAVNNFSVYIGNEKNIAGRFINGDLAEVIMYNAPLNSAQRVIVNNYLAAKYNLALAAADDLYDEDNAGNGNYDHEVAGIGRVNATNTNVDAQGSGMVRILNPVGLGNNEYYMFGHDNGVVGSYTTTDFPAAEGLQGRLLRVWRGSETGSITSFDVRFDLTGLGPVVPATLRLLIDTDNDGIFADETVAGGGVVGGASLIGGNVYSFTAVTGLNDNLRFTLGSLDITSTPLPVELLDFSGILNKNKVELSWSTATEKNSDYFDVERSIDAQEFTKVGTQKAAGNSNKILKYSNIDESPLNGISYYRLKQFDTDGSFHFSNIISINVIKEKKVKFIVYPNPNKGEFTADISGIENNHEVQISLRDEKGVTVYDSKFFIQDDNSNKLNIVPETKLPNGLYICTLTLEGIDYHVKVIVN